MNFASSYQDVMLYLIPGSTEGIIIIIIIIIYKMFIQGAPSAMPFFQGSLFTNLLLKIKVS